MVRSGPAVEVRQNKFANESSIAADAFLRDLRTAMESFSQFLTADFQVTSIEAGPLSASAPAFPQSLRTGVRYELVGQGRDFHREQRVGQWELEWESSAAGEFRVRRWRVLGETQSRSASPVFADVTAPAFTANPSYAAQLLHGADYWRSVLDVACGIDLYGHNGVSVGDIDNDGFDDLYVCQPAGLPNRLYRNRGDGTFEDVTEASGVGILENTACALFADFDNDGHQDLIVVRTNGPLLFLNDGSGKFHQKPDAFQFLQAPAGTFTGAAVADYDCDGWLDIYFCLYLYYQGTDQYKYPSPYFDARNGPPNFLMRNQRDGTFRDVTAATGLNQNNNRYSFCCGWSDYNRDGWPDLYVVNDFGRKNLYRNNGDGTFTDVASPAGVEDVGAGMSVCWFDYNKDAADDLYVANMWSGAGLRISTQEVFQKDAPENIRALYRKHAQGNSLFQGETSGRFQDAGASAGVEVGRWAWSSDAWDFDHDGFSDLYVANGMVSGPLRDDLNSFFWRQVVANSPAEAKPSQPYEQGWNALNELIRSDGTWSGYERNVFFANNGDGTFSDVSGAVDLDFLEDGRAFALADFDHDGRQEIFLKNRNGPQLKLLRNVMEGLAPSIAFRLRGIGKSNRDAIGAAITLEAGKLRQTRTLQAGSGFLSQHSKEIFFGLGDTQAPVRASIRWPSGRVQQLDGLPLNHIIWVEEGSQPSRLEPFKPSGPAKSQAQSSPAPSRSRAPHEADLLPESIETWLLAPMAAPDFSLPDFNGQIRTLAALRGKPLLLNFWFSESAGCQNDMKAFNRVHQRWARQGLALLAINVDDNTERARALVRDSRLSFPILKGSDDVAAIYNILYRYLFDRHRDLSLPTSFLIDAGGDIVKVYLGAVNPGHVEHDFQNIPQTAAQRLEKGLPFAGVGASLEVQRNYLSYGSVFFQRGYLDQAEASFRLALRDDPSSAEALYGLGSVYLKQQKSGEARDSFERAIKVQASYPDTLANSWNNLGLLAARDGQTAAAISYFMEVLKLNPDHLIALTNLGNAYRKEKNWDAARQALERAVAIGPQDPEANYSLGMVFAQLNDNEQADEYLQRSLQFRPDYPEALNNLGVLYLRSGRRDEGVASFEKSIRVAPAFDQSYMNLARLYALEGALDKARSVLQELLKRRPDYTPAQQMLDQLAGH